MTTAPFTADQVLAALLTATRPLSTSDVARLVRDHLDVGGYYQPADVNRALAELERGGKVVSGRAGKEGGAYRHLVSTADHTPRYWATPALSDQWLATLAERQDAVNRMAGLAADITRNWVKWGGPDYPSRYPGNPPVSARIQVTSDNQSVTLDLTGLSPDQAAWLVSALAEHGRSADDAPTGGVLFGPGTPGAR